MACLALASNTHTHTPGEPEWLALRLRPIHTHPCCGTVSRPLLWHGLPTPVVARSPDRATCPDRRSPRPAELYGPHLHRPAQHLHGGGRPSVGRSGTVRRPCHNGWVGDRATTGRDLDILELGG